MNSLVENFCCWVSAAGSGSRGGFTGKLVPNDLALRFTLELSKRKAWIRKARGWSEKFEIRIRDHRVGSDKLCNKVRDGGSRNDPFVCWPWLLLLLFSQPSDSSTFLAYSAVL